MNIFASHGFVSISNYTDEPLNDEERMRTVEEYEKKKYTLYSRGVKFWEKLFLVVNFFRLYVILFVFFLYLFLACSFMLSPLVISRRCQKVWIYIYIYVQRRNTVYSLVKKKI